GVALAGKKLDRLPYNVWCLCGDHELAEDRKSTRLNSSHQIISYAVFCLKKKNHQGCAGSCRHVARPRRPHPDAPDTHRGLTFFFNDTATTEIYTLSLHDALPISVTTSWP